MICPYCGKENAENERLCAYCGGFLLKGDNQNPSEVFAPYTASQPVLSPSEPVIDVEQPVAQPEALTGYEQPLAQPEILPAEQFQPPAKASKQGCGKWIWWLVGCFILICLLFGCVAAFWGLYSSRSVLDFLHQNTSSAGSDPGSSNLLFSDDFSNTSSGWDRVSETDYLTDYFENAYRITVNTDMTDIWANPANLSFADMSVEVEATKNGGPDDNDFGVICRYQDVEHFYYGIITSDGYFGIIKTTTDGSTTIGRDSLGYSDLIQQGFSTNNIRFDCIGDTLTLFVGGEQLDQQTDSDYTYGNVGLTAGTYATAGADILFDNFKVYQP
jgi:hypothetical protein